MQIAFQIFVIFGAAVFLAVWIALRIQNRKERDKAIGPKPKRSDPGWFYYGDGSHAGHIRAWLERNEEWKARRNIKRIKSRDDVLDRNWIEPWGESAADRE